MLICNRCGATYEEEDLPVVRERHDVPGNSMASGYIVYSETSCPSCSGDLVEATECPICGEWINPDENDGVHEDCYKEKCRNLENVVAYARSLESDAEDLYTLLTDYVFSNDEVVEILLKSVREAYALLTDKSRIDDKLQAFTDVDKSHFAEWAGRQ